MNTEDSATKIVKDTKTEIPETETDTFATNEEMALEQKQDNYLEVTDKNDTVESLEAVDVNTIIKDAEAYLSRVNSGSFDKNDKQYLVSDAVGKIYSFISDADSRVHAERLKLRDVNESLGLDTKNWREAESQEINHIKSKKSLGLAAIKILEADGKKISPPELESTETDNTLSDNKTEDLIKESAEQEKFIALRSLCSGLVEPLDGLQRVINMRRRDNLPIFLGDASPSLLRRSVDTLQDFTPIDTKVGRDGFVSNVQEAVQNLNSAFSQDESFQERGVNDDLESLTFYSRKLREVGESINYFSGSVYKLGIQELEEIAPAVSALMDRIENIESTVSRRCSAVERYLGGRY